MENPKFQIFKGSNNQFYFRLRARNGEIILNSEGYINKQGCYNGIDSVKTNAPYDNRYKRLTSTNSQYYFVLTAANNEVIGTSQMYATIQAREIGVEAVKKDAPNSPIEDFTI